ncbi:MAG: TonB-dependent siderophore receptor [Ottowia sp.]|uniref:TonB-dependent siderophore receptor n=1 Tax=Ottowia sp. TaxID=1898956 RepID=UPI0039E571F3
MSQRSSHLSLSAPGLRPTALAAAVHLALAGVLLTGWQPAAHAQAAAADARSYDIPAGPLGTVLKRFATESGVLLAATSELVQGRQSPGVRGSYSAQAALAALLAGTGLAAEGNAQGGYRLQVADTSAAKKGTAGAAATNANVSTLAEVTVTAEADRDGTTEGSGSYKAAYTNTATKLNLTPRETPQTVTVITRQQMDDLNTSAVSDALQYASGVQIQQRGAQGETLYSRGFTTQSQFDGVPNPIGLSEYEKGSAIDTAFLDRIEVFQGAAGLTSGAGDPGGTINLVRKRPTQDFQASVEARVGSWSSKRLLADVSGPLIESGRVRGRLVGLNDDGDSFSNYTWHQRRGLYGVVEANLSLITLLTASVQYEHEKLNAAWGIPFAADGSDLNLPRSSYFGNPRAWRERDSVLYTLALEQKLANDWKLNATFIHGSANNEPLNYSYTWGSVDRLTGDGLNIYQQAHFDKEMNSNAFDVNVSGKFDFLGRTHEGVFGTNGYSFKNNMSGNDYNETPVNVYTFNPALLADSAVTAGYTLHQKTTQAGVYGAVRLNLSDSLKAIVGARVTNYEFKDPTDSTSTSNTKKNGVVQPYGGLLYDINKQYTAYASYSSIFSPQSDYTAIGGGTLKPVVGKNYEVGVKGEVLDKRLNVNVAVFRLDQTNLPVLDSSATSAEAAQCNGYCYKAAGLVRSQGIDLGVNGAIGEGWNVMAGYTYVNSKYMTGDTSGWRYNDKMPQHQLRLATTYRIPNTAFTIGGNVRFQSKIDSYPNAPDTSAYVHQGSLAVYGLTAKYQINRQAEITLAINNLFDKRYYSTISPLTANFYGDPRNGSINFKYRF